MPELRLVPDLSEHDMVEAYFRLVAAMPWKSQTCNLCQHPRHCTPCPEVSEDDPSEKCSCGWVTR